MSLDRMRCAVSAAETGSQWWELAARAQWAKRGESVEHGDLYGLAGEIVTTLRTLEGLAEVLAHQAAGYGEGRALRDDDGADPMERLEDAGVAAHHTRAALAVAQHDANAYWSAIGHIGLRYVPDEPREGGWP